MTNYEAWKAFLTEQGLVFVEKYLPDGITPIISIESGTGNVAADISVEFDADGKFQAIGTWE